MELYEAVNKRKTTREFLDTEVDFEAIKRILEAGNKAPTWDHNRNDRSYWEMLDAPPVIVNYFYHEQIKKSAQKEGTANA